jgi:multisubunit Na+/H+ antiporter MnhF subunit
MLLGVAILFFNGKSVIGWVLTVGGLLFIIVGIIANMDIYFQRTSLWNTLIMLVLLAGGMGLVFKSLRPH